MRRSRACDMAGALSSSALSSIMGIGAASVPLIGCPRFLAAPEMEGQNGSKIRPATSVDRPSADDLRPDTTLISLPHPQKKDWVKARHTALTAIGSRKPARE